MRGQRDGGRMGDTGDVEGFELDKGRAIGLVKAVVELILRCRKRRKSIAI